MPPSRVHLSVSVNSQVATSGQLLILVTLGFGQLSGVLLWGHMSL